MTATQRYDGEGFEIPHNEVYQIICCDCGLVHDFVFATESGLTIGAAARRNVEATADWRAAHHAVPNMLPEALVKQLIKRFYLRTKTGSQRPSEALRELINTVYAQGVKAASP